LGRGTARVDHGQIAPGRKLGPHAREAEFSLAGWRQEADRNLHPRAEPGQYLFAIRGTPARLSGRDQDDRSGLPGPPDHPLEGPADLCFGRHGDPAPPANDTAEFHQLRLGMDHPQSARGRAPGQVGHDEVNRVRADIDRRVAWRRRRRSPRTRLGLIHAGASVLPESGPCRSVASAASRRDPIVAGIRVSRAAPTRAAASAGESVPLWSPSVAAAEGRPSCAEAASAVGTRRSPRASPPTWWTATTISTSRAMNARAPGSPSKARRSSLAPRSTKKTGTRKPSARPLNWVASRVGSRRW